MVVAPFFFAFGVSATAVAATIPQSERDALIAIGTSTGASRLSGWGGNAGTECAWAGITCDGTPNVIEIDLDSVGLNGTMPSLQAFTRLQVVRLGNEQFSHNCCFPKNTLSGPMPAIAGIATLTNVDFSAGDVYGFPNPGFVGPFDFTGLASLNSLSLSVTNRAVPDLSPLSELRSLVFSTDGPSPNFSGLANLQTLTLARDSGTEGPWPVSLAGVNSLTSLVLDGRWTMPASLAGQPNLVKFEAFLSVGQIPALAGSTKLQSVSVYGGMVTGPLPSLDGLSALQSFHVNSTLTTGSLPDLKDLTSLQTFEVFDNPSLTGDIGALSNLPALQVFDVHSNGLNGTIPALSGLRSLQLFVVSGNRLSGMLPSLGSQPNLVDFLAAGNLLSGPIPDLQDVLNLSQFDVSNNLLTGTIPSLIDLQSLTTFSVSNNALSGGIPPMPMHMLQSFSADWNKLTGPIPIVNVLHFDVSENQLSGSLPSIGATTEFFAAAGNQLSGTIPAFTPAKNLKRYDLARNHLTGTIPSLPPSLLTFDVDNNELTGDLSNVSFAPAYLFDVSFNHLTGSVLPAVGTDSLFGWEYGGVAALCPNQFDHIASTHWDAATRQSPGTTVARRATSTWINSA